MFQQYGITVRVKDEASKSLQKISKEGKYTATSLAKVRDGGNVSATNIARKRTAAPQGQSSGGGVMSMMSMGGGAGAVVAGFTAIAAGVAVVGDEAISTTSEFEKMSAVLATTLGSNGAAKRSFGMIQEFAADTPFQVDEITDSFVKLASNGFVPTNNELTNLGDLAAAKGKSFDQLSEAMLDAETGEFERLKEFGIKASKAGDKVTFTFKNQKKTVDANGESIRQYILGLGKMQGVSGTMAKVSETMGGQISNMKDGFSMLSYELGTQFRPAIMAGIKGVSGMVKSTTQWLQQNPQFLANMSDAAVKTFDFAQKLGGVIFNAKGAAAEMNLLTSTLGGIAQVGGDVIDWANKQSSAFANLTSWTDKVYTSMMNLSSDDVANGLRGTFNVLKNHLLGRKPQNGETWAEMDKKAFNSPFEQAKKIKSASRMYDIQEAEKNLAAAYGLTNFNDIPINVAGKSSKIGAAYSGEEQWKALGFGDKAKMKALGLADNTDVPGFLQALTDQQMEQRNAKSIASGGGGAGKGSNAGAELAAVSGDKKQIQHININISKLTGIENLVTNNIKEGTAKMADVVMEMLLKGISDTQIMTG